MSEHGMEAELGGGRGLSSFSKMTWQGEGIYASSTSADVGLQRTDQIGLTLSPKTKSGDKLSLDACMITDQDFEEALKQLEPLLAEHEERTPSFRVDPTSDTRRRYVAAPNKRRKLSGDLYELLFQRLSSSPIIRSRSPTLSTASPEPVKVCAENQHYDDGNEIHCPESSGSPHSPPDESPEEIEGCQEDLRNALLSAHENVESVEETNSESIAFQSSYHSSTNGCGISATESDYAISGNDHRGQGRGVQNGHDSEMSNYGTCDEKSADVTNVSQGKVFGDPDVPLQSIEKENQGLGVNCHTDMRSSRSRSFGNAAVYGVSIGFPSSPSQTIAGVATAAANETTQNFEPSQDSHQSSQKSLQTPTLASIARLFLQSSRQALVEDYSKSLSSHQIPAELRKRFHALLRKFQSDEQFQKAVTTYAMELAGAVSPGKSDSYSLPLKLRQAFDALTKKTNTDESFKMSVDKFMMEYLRDKKVNEDLISKTTELDGIQLYDNFHRKDLDKLSMDQLTKYCRELEVSRAHFAKELRSAKDHARKLGNRENDKHRPLIYPKDPIPKPGTWTCFHPQTTRKGNKDEPCGNSNPHYERGVVWTEITHCKTCKGPYNKDFESQKQKTSRKKYYKSKAGETAPPDARQSPANTQTNDPENAHNDFGASSITHQDPSMGASSSQMHGYLAEDDQDDTRPLYPGWHSDNDELQHTPVSDRFHSTPMDDPLSSINRSTSDYSPMHSPGFQNSDIGYTDALNLDVDFTGQGGEFDELAINLDPLFMDMDMDPDPQQQGSFPEQTNVSRKDPPQIPQNFSQLPGRYPTQVNLFPQLTSPHSQSQASPTSLHPLSLIVNSTYGAGFGPASSSIQHHEQSRNLAPTQLGQVNKPYQSPYGPIIPSALPQSTNLGRADPAGTLLSFPQSGGMVPLNSATAAWHPKVTSSAGLRNSLQEPVPHSIDLPNMQISLSRSHPNQIMSQTGPAIMITDADSEGLVSDGQTETLGPSYPWSSRPGRRRSPIPKLPRAKSTGPGLGWRAAINADSSPTKKKRAPPKSPRLSRAKAAVAERAALRDSPTKTPEPERPLTESQINQVHVRNKTSAMFLGGSRKFWQEPVESYPPKVIIEIPDDEAAVQDASEVPQGAVADQGASDALDEAFLAEFNAEFDRQDRAAALGVLDEGENENENDAETGGDDKSRHGDRVIAVAAAAAVAEESEESEEE